MANPLSVFPTPHFWRGQKLRRALGAALLVACWGASAQASSVYVRFDGPLLGDPARNAGIGAASIQAALDAAIPLYPLNPSEVGEAVDSGPITLQQSLQSYSDPTSPPVSAWSEWSGESSESVVFSSSYFLIFVTVEPTVPPPADPYQGDQVQIHIDTADGWVLTQIGSLVFPALLLEGLDVEQAFEFDIHYLINRALPLADNMGEDAYFLPQFRLAGASGSAVIPEPASATLLGLGLLWVAARRRRLH